MSDAPDRVPEGLRTQQLYAAVSDVKCRVAVQLLLIQALMEIYTMYRAQINSKNACVLFDALHSIASHAHRINTDALLCLKIQELGSLMQMQDPPLLRLENESYQMCLTLLQNLMLDRPLNFVEEEIETHLVDLCQEVLEFYIKASSRNATAPASSSGPHGRIPLSSRRRRELNSRAPLIVATLQAIGSLGEASFKRHLAKFFPLITALIGCEHGSKDVQLALSEMLHESVGPALMRSC